MDPNLKKKRKREEQELQNEYSDESEEEEEEEGEEFNDNYEIVEEKEGEIIFYLKTKDVENVKMPNHPVKLSEKDKCSLVMLQSAERSGCYTDARNGYCSVRSSHGVEEGSYYFEVVIGAKGESIIPSTPETEYGPHYRIGWSRKRSDMRLPAGSDKWSYSYRDVKGDVFHEGRSKPYGETYSSGDIIGCYIYIPPRTAPKPPPKRITDQFYYEDEQKNVLILRDEVVEEVAEGGVIAFFKNGVCQGVAAKDFIRARYYPTISLYMGAACHVNFGPKFQQKPEMDTMPQRAFKPICALYDPSAHHEPAAKAPAKMKKKPTKPSKKKQRQGNATTTAPTQKVQASERPAKKEGHIPLPKIESKEEENDEDENSSAALMRRRLTRQKQRVFSTPAVSVTEASKKGGKAPYSSQISILASLKGSPMKSNKNVTNSVVGALAHWKKEKIQQQKQDSSDDEGAVTEQERSSVAENSDDESSNHSTKSEEVVHRQEETPKQPIPEKVAKQPAAQVEVPKPVEVEQRQKPSSSTFSEPVHAPPVAPAPAPINVAPVSVPVAQPSVPTHTAAPSFLPSSIPTSPITQATVQQRKEKQELAQERSPVLPTIPSQYVQSQPAQHQQQPLQQIQPQQPQPQTQTQVPQAQQLQQHLYQTTAQEVPLHQERRATPQHMLSPMTPTGIERSLDQSPTLNFRLQGLDQSPTLTNPQQITQVPAPMQQHPQTQAQPERSLPRPLSVMEKIRMKEQQRMMQQQMQQQHVQQARLSPTHQYPPQLGSMQHRTIDLSPSIQPSLDEMRMMMQQRANEIHSQIHAQHSQQQHSQAPASYPQQEYQLHPSSVQQHQQHQQHIQQSQQHAMQQNQQSYPSPMMREFLRQSTPAQAPVQQQQSQQQQQQQSFQQLLQGTGGSMFDNEQLGGHSHREQYSQPQQHSYASQASSNRILLPPISAWSEDPIAPNSLNTMRSPRDTHIPSSSPAPLSARTPVSSSFSLPGMSPSTSASHTLNLNVQTSSATNPHSQSQTAASPLPSQVHLASPFQNAPPQSPAFAGSPLDRHMHQYRQEMAQQSHTNPQSSRDIFSNPNVQHPSTLDIRRLAQMQSHNEMSYMDQAQHAAHQQQQQQQQQQQWAQQLGQQGMMHQPSAPQHTLLPFPTVSSSQQQQQAQQQQQNTLPYPHYNTGNMYKR